MKKGRLYSDEEVETLKKLYKDHFDYEIADILNRPAKSVNAKICSLGLTDRIPSPTLRKLRNWERYEDRYGMPIKDVLYMLHWERELTVRNGMDKELDADPKSVTNWMNELGVPNRSTSEDNHRRYSTMTKEQINAQTLAAHEAIRTNGQPKLKGRIGWSRGLNKYVHSGLKSSSEKHLGKNNPMWNVCGENHPMWKGGKRYWQQKEWYEIREQVKKRDNYTCRECGLTEEESYNRYGQPLQVHHMIPYIVCETHDPDNLITLCNTCHGKADEKRRREERKPKKSSTSDDVNPKQCTIFQF